MNRVLLILSLLCIANVALAQDAGDEVIYTDKDRKSVV